ncbi:hypothetical protein [Mesorhizobium sp. M0898]|uniref:hypothetical protein n=1 Tax=Mesorhizobium sp. M0898 TaxID=2957020 RepID=UPI00333C4C86
MNHEQIATISNRPKALATAIGSRDTLLQTMSFDCPSFSVMMEDEVLIVPGSGNYPIFSTLVPHVSDLDDATGEYFLRASTEGSTICKLPVTVLWATDDLLPDRLLAFIAYEPKLFETLSMHRGKAMSLTFTAS